MNSPWAQSFLQAFDSVPGTADTRIIAPIAIGPELICVVGGNGRSRSASELARTIAIIAGQLIVEHTLRADLRALKMLLRYSHHPWVLMDRLGFILARTSAATAIFTTWPKNVKSLEELVPLFPADAGILRETTLNSDTKIRLERVRVRSLGQLPRFLGLLKSKVTSHPKYMPARVTPAQRRVLTLVLQGYTNLQIATALNLAHPTVRHHVSAIFIALGVANRVELLVNANEELRARAAKENC